MLTDHIGSIPYPGRLNGSHRWWIGSVRTQSRKANWFGSVPGNSSYSAPSLPLMVLLLLLLLLVLVLVCAAVVGTIAVAAVCLKQPSLVLLLLQCLSRENSLPNNRDCCCFCCWWRKYRYELKVMPTGIIQSPWKDMTIPRYSRHFSVYG